MHTFKNKPAGFTALRNKLLFRTVPVQLVAVSALLYLSNQNMPADDTSVNVMPFVIPAVVGLLAYILFKNIRKQRVIWDSFELQVDDQTITRKQANMAELTISKEEIQGVLQATDGSLIIKGPNPGELIITSGSLENQDQLLAWLTETVDITEREQHLFERFGMLLPLLFLGLMMATIFASDPWIVIPAATLSIGFFVFVGIFINREKNIPRAKLLTFFMALISIFFLVRILMSLGINLF